MFVFFNVAESERCARSSPPCSSRGRRRGAGALLDRRPRRAAARRCALRDRPRRCRLSPTRSPYSFSLSSLLAIRTPFQEAREPEEATPLRAQLAEGLALAVGPPVPAHVRAALPGDEPHLRGHLPRAHRRRPPPGAVGRADRRVDRRLRGLFTRRLARSRRACNGCSRCRRSSSRRSGCSSESPRSS